MKNMLLLLLMAAATAHASFSQSNVEIARWVSNHPNVYIMSSDNFQNMSESRKEQLADHIIVYHGEIKMEQLNAYQDEKSVSDQNVAPTKDQDVQEIKDWLSSHQDVKIIKRSVFNNLSTAEQTMYLENNALIMIGETITIQDINNFHY